MLTATSTTTVDRDYDRLREVKQFDESKIGVKGLVDSGITTIPRFFLQPPENLPSPRPTTQKPSISLPVIDLSSPRATLINQIHAAASTLGFFQITNHGIPQTLFDSVLGSMKSFHELPSDLKRQYYRRDLSGGAAYSTNFDLYHSKAASWRDTIQIRMGPNPPEWEYVPEVCRRAVAEWDVEVVRVGEELMGILSEGLGMKREKLKELSCLEARVQADHYYPYCPQPDLTLGLGSHMDPGVLTVLVQNEVVGLQVKCGEDWVDVDPLPGALVINIGDILQIMSNDEYKSVEHRVLANAFDAPRISVTTFFNPSLRENNYGPLPELISPEKPARYGQVIYSDFMRRFFTKELGGKTLTDSYRI
ncbi:hypothetical protein LguiB_025258 [Lonicera macranthoides]